MADRGLIEVDEFHTKTGFMYIFDICEVLMTTTDKSTPPLCFHSNKSTRYFDGAIPPR